MTEQTQQNAQCCYDTDLDHLANTKVLQLLPSISDEHVTTKTHLPVNPKGGNVFLFSYGQDENKKGQSVSIIIMKCFSYKCVIATDMYY